MSKHPSLTTLWCWALQLSLELNDNYFCQLFQKIRKRCLKLTKTFLTGLRKGFFFLNEAIKKQYQTAQSLMFPKKRKRGKAENTSEHLYMKPLWDQECSNLFLGNVQFPGNSTIYGCLWLFHNRRPYLWNLSKGKRNLWRLKSF